jgi:hypothetical protein
MKHSILQKKHLIFLLLAMALSFTTKLSSVDFSSNFQTLCLNYDNYSTPQTYKPGYRWPSPTDRLTGAILNESWTLPKGDAIATPPDPTCGYNASYDEFTKSYKGPNGYISSQDVYPPLHIRMEHIRRLDDGKMIVAGDVADMNSTKLTVGWNPERYMRIPAVQKLDEYGDVLIARRIDQLINPQLPIQAGNKTGRQVVAMQRDDSYVYLLLSPGMTNIDQNGYFKYFELLKLDFSLNVAAYKKIEYSNSTHILPSDMIISGDMTKLYILASYKDQSNEYVSISIVPTTLFSLGVNYLSRLTAGMYSSAQYSTGKLTIDHFANTLYFNFNIHNSTMAHIGKCDLTTFPTATFSYKSYTPTLGEIFVEGLKWEGTTPPSSGGKLLVYGSILDNSSPQKRKPAFQTFDNNLVLTGYAAYAYAPKTATKADDENRAGTFGKNAYIDNIFISANHYVIHTVIEGEMTYPYQYGGFPNYYNMVPGYFSVDKSTQHAINNNFPSVFDANIFYVHERQKHIPMINSEAISGNFEEHFDFWHHKGGTFFSSDQSSNKLYVIDGQRTISVMAHQYTSPASLLCFETINVSEVLETIETPVIDGSTTIQIFGNLLHPTPKATNILVDNNCCSPQPSTPCMNIGDIQVNFTFDCSTNRVRLNFTGADLGNISMLQFVADRNEPWAYAYQTYFPTSPLSFLEFIPPGGVLQTGDEFCITIYTTDGCMKEFCKTLEADKTCTIPLEVKCGNSINLVQQALLNCPECTSINDPNAVWEDITHQTTVLTPNNVQILSNTTFRKILYNPLTCQRCTIIVNTTVITHIINLDIYIPTTELNCCIGVDYNDLYNYFANSPFPYCSVPSGTPSFTITSMGSPSYTLSQVPLTSALLCNGQTYEVTPDNAGPCCVFRIRIICGELQGDHYYEEEGPQAPLQNDNNGLSTNSVVPQQFALKLIPNPSSSIFSIQALNYDGAEFESVEILNATGQVIQTYEKIGINHQYNLADKAKGLYLVRVKAGNSYYQLRLMLQ